MANSEKAQASLDMAAESGRLESALVVGKTDSGKVELFIAESDREAMLALLARAQHALIKSMDR